MSLRGDKPLPLTSPSGQLHLLTEGGQSLLQIAPGNSFLRIKEPSTGSDDVRGLGELESRELGGVDRRAENRAALRRTA